MADKRFVSDQHLTFDCDLDLGRGNLNVVPDIFFILHYLSVKFD